MPAAFPFRIEPLDQQDRAVFSCGTEALDNYFRNQASQDVRKHAAVCFVLVHERTNRVAGFYSLAATSVLATDLPAEFIRKLPRYPQIPATLLARLAVDVNFRRQRLGEFLLMDALMRSAIGSKDIGSVAVIVDAKDEAAVKFYECYEFLRLPGHPQRLFIPMKTVEEMFEP